MSEFPVGISLSGAVFLGRDIACDGYLRDYNVRVQTHIHLDHMDNFDRSKGLQDIYLTEATLKLLIAEYDADLAVRQNLKVLEYGEKSKINNSVVTFLSSGHMLGSAQVMVELDDGPTLGYSSDFQWPLEDTIKVDTLVLDSTYGSPKSVRRYTQQDVEELFLETVRSKLLSGPVHIKSHRGTLERSLQILTESLPCPVLATDKFIRQVDVYREFGFNIGNIVSIKSPEAKEIRSSGKYVRIYGKGDVLPVDYDQGTSICVSAYMAKPDSPIVEYSNKALSIAISDHADFDGTLEYIQATGAKYVITDNYRGGKAVELAMAINEKLGIKAMPSTYEMSKEWGV